MFPSRLTFNVLVYTYTSICCPHTYTHTPWSLIYVLRACVLHAYAHKHAHSRVIWCGNAWICFTNTQLQAYSRVYVYYTYIYAENTHTHKSCAIAATVYMHTHTHSIHTLNAPDIESCLKRCLQTHHLSNTWILCMYVCIYIYIYIYIYISWNTHKCMYIPGLPTCSSCPPPTQPHPAPARMYVFVHVCMYVSM
jgi:hypothetical protein